MIRVSCNALCRIYEPEYGFLMGLNRSRLAQGKRVLMPLGGSLHCYVPEQLANFGIEWETPAAPDGQDLRFVMLADHLDLFRLWFLRGKGRETSPLRELREELVEEYGALPALADHEVSIQPPVLHETRRLSERSNIKVARTHYFNEVYDVNFAPPVLHKICEFTAHSDSLHWITREQIDQGHLDAQTTITAVF